jgi:hypothetical protein
MGKKPLQITLIPSPADPSEDSDEYQVQLRRFDDSLRRDGFNPSSVIEIMEAVGHDIAHHLGVFNVVLSGSFAALNIALGAWIKEKYGRTVELEVGGVKAKAATVEELREILEIAQEFQDHNEPKRLIPSASI